MTTDNDPTRDARPQPESLRNAMRALEAQRALLGDAVVEPALAALRAQLALLEANAAPLRSEPAAAVQPASAEAVSATSIPAAPGPPGPSALADERRIVTILFCDMVGSTPLAEQLDPEDWHNLAAQVHATSGGLVQAHHGQVVQYLGDGLLALFGAQSPGEYDPENAVRAALEIQQTLAAHPTTPPVQLRIGIHTGLALVGNIGAETFQQFTAMGDAMNLAARLQTAAPPGGVLISHDTQQHVRGVFDVTAQPPLLVKGKSEPIQTYVVHRARHRPFQTVTRGVRGIATRTVGRAAEWECLQAAFADALASRGLVWAQLIGEAGMGKSRLLGEFSAAALRDRDTLAVLQARAIQGEEHQAFGLVRRMWFERFQIAEDAPLAEAEARWEAGFLSLGGPGGAEAAHALGLLLGLPFADSPHIGAMRADPAQVKGRAMVVSRELLAATRARAPLLLLLEDLHWADASSWEYIQHVVLPEGSAAHGLCVVAAARPEWQPPQALLQHPAYREVPLAALSDAACHELVRALLARVSGVPGDVSEMVAARAEGVPYYAEEMINWFLDRQIIDAAREPWRFDSERLQMAPLPTTLQHLLLTRLGALADGERSALQRGAIFGRSFWEGGLAALGAPQGGALLGPLGSRGFVDAQVQSSLEGEREWSFHHTLLREVTYESVLKRERQALHRAAGLWLETQAQRAGRLDEITGILGEHAEHAGERGAAAAWYLRAGERARARGAFHEARTFFERTLALAPPANAEQIWRAQLGRNEVASRLGDAAAQQSSLAALLALAPAFDEEHRATAHYREALSFDHQGEYARAVEVYDTALAAAQRGGHDTLAATILSSKLIGQHRLGDVAGAARTAQEVLSRAQGIEEGEAVRPLSNLAVYYVESGDLAQAAQVHQATAETVHRLGDRAAEAIALSNLGYDYICLGMPEAARAPLERSIALHHAIGARRLLTYARLNAGLAHWRSGDARAARELFESLQEELAAGGDKFAHAAGLTYLALAIEHAGDVSEAAQQFASARAMFNAIGVLSGAADALAGLARCALALGQANAASAYVNELWAYLAQHGAHGMEFPVSAYLASADVFAALGDAGRARAAAEEGHQELARRAARISNPAWRDSFLENVPEHRAIRRRTASFNSVP